MEQSPLEQLKQLSDKIEGEEMAIIINRLAESFIHQDNEQTELENPRKVTEREKCATILLRSMRIHLCLDLIHQDYFFCNAQFQKDWNEIISCLKFMECEWEITNEILGDAVDIITLLNPGKRKELLHLLDFTTRLKIKKRKPLRYSVIDCAIQMAVYCAKTNRIRELLQIADSLISLSEERNIAALDKHRAITSEWLAYIIDIDHSLTAKICDAQQKYYKGVSSLDACKFHWFHAFSLLVLGREEEAIPLLKYCHDLCIKVEGETSWIGVRAGSLYQHRMLLTDKADDAEKYLWDTLSRIESGFYRNMDDTAPFVAATTRAVLLSLHLNNQTMRGFLPEIQRFWDYCKANEATNINPELTVRHAENMLAAYYLETGNYLQAADHSVNALNSIPPNNLPRKPSDVLLYSNLLLIYINLNNIERIGYYMQKLSELYPEYENDEATVSRVSLLFNTARKKVEFESDEKDTDDLAEARQTIHDFYCCICEGEIEPAKSDMENISYAEWMLDLCSTVVDSFSAERQELICLRRIVDYFLERPGIYKFTDVQKCTCYTFLTQIEWQLGSDKALEHVEKCLRYAHTLDASREVRITILRFAAATFHHYHRLDHSRSVLKEVFSGITAAWQKATAYLNDKRVCQLLNFIQWDFSICFGILRTCASDCEVYERVLQFKDLPALVGRERNKLLRLPSVDEQLKQQIFAKQNQLADVELNDALNGTNHAQRISTELEHLEAQFAARFPKNLTFTEISFHKVCEKLPNHSAIVEYYFSLSTTPVSDNTHSYDAWELDIFITAKRGGTARLDHLKLKQGDLILTQAEAFTRILQDSEDLTSGDKKEKLRNALYRSLLAPVMPFLVGITELYIAPDRELCNLPFEILHADESGILQDQFKVCRLVCGRDLLFFDNHEPVGGGCFILGDPDYESERGEITTSHLRSAKISLEPVAELPFSGIEAARIGRYCRTQIYSGHAATKYSLQNALPCSIIHLATHGVFDEEMETDSLYSSHLVFAGYNKWVTNKTESKYCGNGILTADEISRMDLKKTELVVLSACQSGLGDTSYGSVRGLLSAFSAAGARWIVSHMWRANDFATSILMDAFYDALMNRGYDVPDALQYAKHYLKNATIGVLSQNGWLDIPDNGRFGRDIIEAAKDMRSWPQDYKPFENECFWGGFTVHKSR